MFARHWLSLLLLVGVLISSNSAFITRRAALRARARQEAADRLRRGFQNSALATARGFGKRSELPLDKSFSPFGQDAGETLGTPRDEGHLVDTPKSEHIGDGNPINHNNKRTIDGRPSTDER